MFHAVMTTKLTSQVERHETLHTLYRYRTGSFACVILTAIYDRGSLLHLTDFDIDEHHASLGSTGMELAQPISLLR